MDTLEEKLGYTFRNRALLEEALRHSSYVSEHREEGVADNERLEFLGDSILGFVAAESLFFRHPDAPEGDLTRTRVALVREESLHEVALRLDLGSYLKLGNGEETRGERTSPSILADATEAVFAAVYLDGGMEPARDLIHRVLLDRECEEAVKERRRDYKTALQELIQKQPEHHLSYQLTGSSGPEHKPTFFVSALLDGETVGTGSGHSKKEAEQMAACAALERLRE